MVNGQVLKFAKCVIATGGRPTVPPINGLERVPFYTSENIFNLTDLPPRMVLQGSGPIACELGQAFARFGSQVTIVTRGSRILSKEEPQVSELMESIFTEEGITIIKNASISIAEVTAEGSPFPTLKVTLTGSSNLQLDCEVLLVAAGRSANVEELGLEAAGVEQSSSLIRVNDFLQTTNGDIYAVGDCATHKQFTHVADAMARIAIKNALFFGRSTFSSLVIPRVTYTDPEVAVTELSLAEIEASAINFRVFEKSFSRLDRAIVDRYTTGFLKIYCNAKSDNILGAVIVGARAGEIINELTLAITQQIGLTKIAGVIHPYPTYGEAVKSLADEARKEKLSTKSKIVMREILGARR
jgi:pyruvate/2-oxoglutarate dehydrogenase complex dihydrolipoamide dehydrogenase (E3) component